MKKKHVLLGVFLALLGLAMLAGLGAVVMPKRFMNIEIVFTIMVVGAHALGMLMIVALGRRMRVSMGLALVATLVSMVALVAGIWASYRWDDFFLKIALASLALALACTHRLIVVPLEHRTAWGYFFKRVALLGGGLSALCFIVFVMTESLFNGEDLMLRLLSIGLLITAWASIGVGAISLFGPRPGEDEPDAVAPSIPVTLTCPVCETTLDAMSNTAGYCGGCNLQIEVRTQEMRCACGYLLHKLGQGVCPECGTPVDAGERWGAIA